MKNKINWKIRLTNPVFWIQVGGAIILTALTYNSMQPEDLTTWQGLGSLLYGVITNPFLLFSCGWSVSNAVNDPTTTGITDSAKALSYETTNAEK